MSATIDSPALNTLAPASSYVSTSLHDAVKLRLGKTGLTAVKPQTIPDFFRERCLKYAQRPALVYQPQCDGFVNSTTASAVGSEPRDLHKANNWLTCTYVEYAERVEQAALLLLHIGLQPHSSVGILALNCPEWCYAEIGTFCAGGVVAGIYPSSSAEAVHHALETSEATVCIVDDSHQMAKVRAVKGRLPRLRAVVQLHGPYDEFVGTDDGYYRWSDLMTMQFGDKLKKELVRREQDVMANECALLIYTSGTVGMPKAVMLSHDSLIFDTKNVVNSLFDIEAGAERIISYLPLNHIAAQILDIFFGLAIGGCVFFAERNALKGSLQRSLLKARPTRFFGVPRVFEKIMEKIKAVEATRSGFYKYFMEKARNSVRKHNIEQMIGKSPALTLCYWFGTIATHFVRASWGLDKCKSFFVGAAPCNSEIKEYFLGLDIKLKELYGLSESSGPITFQNDYKSFDNVGKCLEGFEIKIYNPNQDGQGEICIRGRDIFMGYLNDITSTKDAITEDGWFHTGDMGFLDIEGNLSLSGRIKELVITAGGENIPPLYIEDLVKHELPGISNVFLVGDRRKYLTMLLTIKTEFDSESGLPTDKLRPEAIQWMKSLGLHYTRVSEVLSIPADMRDVDASNVEITLHPALRQSIQDGIDRVNAKAISNAHRVQRFALLPHDFSVPTGELGETLKLRRTIVLQKYANIIENMYKL